MILIEAVSFTASGGGWLIAAVCELCEEHVRRVMGPGVRVDGPGQGTVGAVRSRARRWWRLLQDRQPS